APVEVAGQAPLDLRRTLASHPVSADAGGGARVSDPARAVLRAGRVGADTVDVAPVGHRVPGHGCRGVTLGLLEVLVTGGHVGHTLRVDHVLRGRLVAVIALRRRAVLVTARVAGCDKLTLVVHL